ncbi:MAG TPA: cyclic nucleotide-binding domain-containing protein [Polyangiaceae bacterium]|nr:cyclic nucleotide-binding domain-containing protein [Polyangiaceae bacterium]
MRIGPPELPGGALAESPIDRALALSLSGERDAALRWAAAVVQADPQMPSGLLMCGRLLAEANRLEGAREALELCLQESIESGNLPLAVAACSDLRQTAVDPTPMYRAIADAFCAGAARADAANVAPPQLPGTDAVHPLPSVLTGMALLSRTAEIIRGARKSRKDRLDARSEPPRLAPLPLFSDFSCPALLALVQVFEVRTVPNGAVIIDEGEEGAEAYILARGELEARKSVKDADPIVLSRLTAGALFGEMALLSRAPRAASVVACRPSVILVARKDALDAVATEFPEIGTRFAEYCRNRMVQNLVHTNAILKAVAPEERSGLIDSFVTRTFEPGDTLIRQNETSAGLFLIASGAVQVVREEAGERLVLSTLGPGGIAGEVSLVLRKPSTARVIAAHPTLALHLPRESFLSIIRKHPAVLYELYTLAVARDEETNTIVGQEALDVDDTVLV